jgi:uncharacterized protein (TIRG00374 family)
MRLPSPRAISLSVGLAVLLYLGMMIWGGWQDVWAAARKAGFGVIGLMLVLSLLNYGLRFLRWHGYLMLLGHSPSWRDDLHIYVAGFALTTTPGKAGEMARSLWLKSHGVPMRASVAAFFAERFQDIFAVALLCCVGLAVYPAGTPLIIGCLVAITLALLVLARPQWLRRLHIWAESGTGRLARFAAGMSVMVLEFRRCFSPLPFLGGLLIGLVGWCAEAAAFGILLSALGADVPATTAAFIYAFAMLAGAVSFLPGGLGGAEAAMLAILEIVGVGHATAVAATLLLRLTTLWFAVGLGIVAVSTLDAAPRHAGRDVLDRQAD